MHLPVGIWAGFCRKNGRAVQGIYWDFHREKANIPAISLYYKGDCHEVEEASVGLGHVTQKYSMKPPETVTVNYSYILVDIHC